MVPTVYLKGLVSFHTHVNRTKHTQTAAAAQSVVIVTEPGGTEESGGGDELNSFSERKVTFVDTL